MPYLLGIDIGTSGTKTVLFNLKGNAAASSIFEYPMYQPKTGWAEQDPNDWWNAVVKSIKDVIRKSGIRPADVKGIGLSGQMHGLVLLDKNNKVLRPSIIWCDQRTGRECEEITSRIGAKRLIEITANPALTGFTASKVMWVKKNEPQIYDKTAHILLPKDYIRFMLTGEYATEVSDASGMQFMNIAERNWSSEVLSKLDIDPALLAKVYESIEISGKINKSASELTGLMEGTPVAGGAGDQAAGAVGNGIVRSGVVSATIGTSGVVFAYTDKVIIDPLGRVHTFCHAVPNTWHIMGVTQGAGLSLKWFRDNFCQSEKEAAAQMGIDPYELLNREAALVPPGCEGLIYLPYLMGERTPHLDPNAKGVFFGLTARHTRRDMLRAVMEGVTYSLLDCMEIIRGMKIQVDEVRASGGGGRSLLWRQMLSDMFGIGVMTVSSTEGPALGVALLAGVGAGIYKNVPQACETAIQTVSQQQPNEANSMTYLKYYRIYQDLYKSLREQYKTLDRVMSEISTRSGFAAGADVVEKV